MANFCIEWVRANQLSSLPDIAFQTFESKRTEQLKYNALETGQNMTQNSSCFLW